MKKLLCFLWMIGALLLTGCIEGDISHIGVVKGVAFDVGETAEYRMTLSVLGKDGGMEVLSAEGDTIGEMKADIARQTPKYPFGGHNQIIFISDELPSCEYLIGHFASEGERNGTEYVAVVKGEAAQCLTQEDKDGLISPVDAVGVIDDAQDNGEILRATVYMVKNASQAIGNTITVPYCAVQDGQFMVLGMAVLNHYTVTGVLTEDEAIGAKFLLVTGEKKRLTVDLDGERADLELRDVKVDLKVRSSGYEVSVEGLVEAGLTEDRQKVISATEEYISSCISGAYAAAQENGDFLNLAARTLNTDGAKLEKYRDTWQEKLRDMSMTVSVSLK